MTALSIGAIRARHLAPPPIIPPDAPAEQPELPLEAEEWLAAVDAGGITRTPRQDGGYELRVRGARAAVVLPTDAGRVVVNVQAGGMRSPALGRAQADTLALRIARLLVMP